MGTDDLSPHTSSRYDEDLARVRDRAMQMGNLVERQLAHGIAGLVRGDPHLAELVAEEERQVNQLECTIDEDCSRILATRSPTASDLRLVVAILKVATDLERIGDEAKKIVRLAGRLTPVDHPRRRATDMDQPRRRLTELRHLADSVAIMLHDALDAFARADADAAIAVARRDRFIDEEYEAIQRQSITFMMEDPRAIRRALDVMWAVRALERIGDHAKNLCEHVILIVHGKDVRHTRIEDVEQALRERREGAAPGL